ncbi:hypothetical protein ACEQPO_28545 [Bacillus sp. SL00103]
MEPMSCRHLVQNTNPQQIIEEMLGAPIEEQFPLRTPLKDAPIVLEVKAPKRPA